MAIANGKSFEMCGIDAIQQEFLETFPFDSPNQLIKIVTHEFSSVCPFSGLPDLATVEIEYHADGGVCVELKSLKYYFISFRLVGIYQEPVTARIYRDLKALLKTERLVVKTVYDTRGGFDTTCIEGKL